MFQRKLAQKLRYSKSWIVKTRAWVTLGYCGLVILAWLLFGVFTGRVFNFENTPAFRLGTLVPIVGPILFPIGRPLLGTGYFFIGFLTLGMYVESFLGHKRFLACISIFFTIIQYLNIANHFSSVMLEWTILVLVGIAIIAVWKRVPYPGWLQAVAAVSAYLFVDWSMPTAIDARFDYVNWLSWGMLIAGGAAALGITRNDHHFQLFLPGVMVPIPWGMIGLCTVLIVFFVVEVFLSGGLDHANMVRHQSLGALGLPKEIDSVAAAVRQILLGPFLQQSLGHLVSNLIGVGLYGFVVERFFGHSRAVWAAIVSGFGAGIIRSVVTLTATGGMLLAYSIGVGASGIVFALAGMGLVSTFFDKNLATGTKAVFYFSAFYSITSAVSGIINGGLINPTAEVGDDVHVYGLLIGFIFGLFILLWHRFVSRHTLPGLRTN